MEGLAIGHFRITRKIGSGGMAEVYEAKHELMDRYAAVKLLRPEMSAQEIIVRRFIQEAQAAASIEHPGIVHVYDVGYTPDGRAYLVMELLTGETLGQRLQRHKRLSLEATVTAIRQLAGVMGAAHQRGIIHRDLKPDNIFLVPDPEIPHGERVKVLDFGLAKLLQVAFPRAELTAQGAVFGTPAYMAPEQCHSAGNVDQRADLYAIGCIFYMCLCGHAPFGTGGIEVLLAHVSQEPVPPRQHAPDIPPAIEELILQLLAKDPDRRWPSCETFIAQLDRLVEARAGRLGRGRSQGHDEPTMRADPPRQGAMASAAAQRAPSVPPMERPQPPRRQEPDNGVVHLDDNAIELFDSEQVQASSRETAQVPPHQRATERMSKQSRRLAGETRPMRKQERAATAQTPRQSPGPQRAMAQTPHTPPGPDMAMPKVPRALPGVPDLAAESPLMTPTAHPPAETSKHATTQAIQVAALPWQPDGPGGGAQQLAETAAQRESASRGSIPTLSSGELEHRPRREPRRTIGRRAAWVMVGVVGLGGLVAGGLVLGKGGSKVPVLETLPSNRPAAPVQVVASPAQTPETIARLAKIDDLLHRAEQALDAKDWDSARKNLAEAHATEAIDDGQGVRVDGLARRLSAEKHSQEAFERLGAAAEKLRIEDVIEILGQIPDSSVYRAEAHAAALEAVHTRARRLAREAECKKLDELIVGTTHAFPELQDQLQAHGAKCAQAAERGAASKRDPGQILDEAREAYERGDFDSTSSSCEALRKLRHVDEMATSLCGLAACKRRDEAAARWYYQRPWPQPRSLIAQTCLKEFGYDVQK